LAGNLEQQNYANREWVQKRCSHPESHIKHINENRGEGENVRSDRRPGGKLRDREERGEKETRSLRASTLRRGFRFNGKEGKKRKCACYTLPISVETQKGSLVAMVKGIY